MPETALPIAAAPHTNHQLFSDHYLSYTLPQRADWAALREAAHDAHTDAIIKRAAALNARVYAPFGLVGAEIALIEAATKYHSGEV